MLWSHLFCSSSPNMLKKNNSTDLCSGDFVPCTICTQDQRESHNHKEAPLKGSREASSNFSYFSQWSFCDSANNLLFALSLSYESFFWGGLKMAENETTLLLTRSAINCYECLFVMTPNTNLNDLSQAILS